tara:strand:- start:1630 stop:1935 length:306 start_codon:yes stop_codon:yes gene_type:complete
MGVLAIILIVTIVQSALLYYLRNSRTFISQSLISLAIVILYFTLIPELYVFYKSFEGCAFPGLGIYMVFWIVGLFASLLVFLLFLLIRNRKHSEEMMKNKK